MASAARPCWAARRGAASIALALFLFPAAAHGAGNEPLEPRVPPPLPWQDPAPFARMFLQLPFEGPEVVPPRTLWGELRLLYSNSILIGNDSSVALEVLIETAQPTAFLRYGIARGVELQLAVPGFFDFGGFLGAPIDFVERLLGTSNPQREDRPPHAAWFRLTRQNGTRLVRDGTGAGIGDVWSGVKVLVVDQAGSRPALALRAAVKLPSGRPPYGSGELDMGGGLLAGWSWGIAGLRLEVDAIVPTANFAAADIATHVYGTAQLGVGVRLSEVVAIHAQWSSHVSPLTGTGLRQLDAPTHYVLAGLSVALSPSATLEAGVVENVFSPHWGADFTALFDVRAGF